jgi:predicted dehydrogenase
MAVLAAELLLAAGCGSPARVAGTRPDEIRLAIVDPGHFHAALIQRDMYPGVSPRVSVYGPLGPELLDYLNRVSLFNTRSVDPTKWELDVHAAPDSFDRMLRDRTADVAVFAGRNRGKIDRIARSLEAGMSVLADKPWIISPAELPKLASALDTAEARGLVGYDIMTERYEITSVLQRELVNAPEVFGELLTGTQAQPAIAATSIHHLMKMVSGVPLRRPAWFFNIEENGEGMADVGTHVIDLVNWTAFPRQELDYRKDIRLLAAERRPTAIGASQWEQVTGEKQFPAGFAQWVKGGRFEYYCNHSVSYAVRGVNVNLNILWNWEAPPGSGDVYEAAYRGSRARVEIRQGKEENFQPEVYVVPASPALRDEVFGALRTKLAAMGKDYPGIDVSVRGDQARLAIPQKYRLGHEAHFAQVAKAFLGYLKDPKSLPRWEKSNMLAKYFISTQGVEMSRGH